MKKTITLLFLIFTVLSFSQTVDYKNAHRKKESNYFEIVDQMRQELAPLRSSTSKIDIKRIKQFERWAYYWKDRVDLEGNFPSELTGYYNAGILNADGTINTSIASMNRSAQSMQSWVNIGPQTVPDANGYPNAPQMGRLTSFKRYVKVPEAQNVIFVTAPVGGIWKSTDNGNTWSPKLDYIAGIGVTDLDGASSDANNPGTIYVSTGDYDADHIKSIGVLKSTDFGETYQSTGLTFTLDQQETTSNLIVLDNNTVIVGTNKFIKKTTDGGATWTNKYVHNYDDAMIGKFHRSGTNIMACDSWGGLLFSSDSGETWTQLIVEGNSYTRHASTTNDSGVFYVQNEAGQVYSYDPFATSPALTSVGIPTTGYNAQGVYNQAIAVKDGLIISGGVDAINSDNNGGFWYTTLNNAWEDNSSAGSYGHADIHEMGPLDSGYSFWALNDGGLIYFDYANISDETPTVEYISDGVVVTQIYSVAISPQSEDHKIIGNQDNDGYSLEMKDGTLQWVSALAGDGTCTAIDYTNPQIRYLGAQNGVLSRTDIGFQSYDSATFLNTPATGAPFVWTLKMNSTIPTTLYGGFAEVYKTTDKGVTWNNLNSGAGQISYIETFGNNLMVIGDNGARKSSDDGVSWSGITEPEATAQLNSLSLNQNNNSTIYATVNGYVDGSKVFKSTNGGSTWTNISEGLPNVKMTQVVFKQNQGTNEILFAGTEIGTYFKVGTADWEKLGQGLPNVNISDIEINYTVDKLVAATYGRGLWEISINNNTLGVEELEIADNQTPVIFPNPVLEGELNIKIPNSTDKYEYVMYNVVGGLVSKGQLNPGLNAIDVNDIASGVYVVRMVNGNYVSTQKIVIK